MVNTDEGQEYCAIQSKRVTKQKFAWKLAIHKKNHSPVESDEEWKTWKAWPW